MSRSNFSFGLANQLRATAARKFLRSFSSRPVCARRFSERNLLSRATTHGENIGLRAASRHYLSPYCLLLHLSKSRKWLHSIAERHWTADCCRPLYSSAPMDNLHNAEALESFFQDSLSALLAAGNCKARCPTRETGRKGAWNNRWASDKRHFRILWKVFEKWREHVQHV